MSGPKSSKYTLTPEQRRILEEQRKLEKRKAAARASMKNSRRAIADIISDVNSKKAAAEEALWQTGNDGGFGELIKALEDISSKAAKAYVNTEKDADSLEKQAENIKTALSQAQEIKNKIALIAENNEKELKKAINTAVDLGFSRDFTGILSPEEEKREELLKELENAEKEDVLSENMKNELATAKETLKGIKNLEFLGNYEAIILRPLLKKAGDAVLEYRENIGEYERLYAEYEALSEILGEKTREFAVSTADMELLKDEIARIEEELANDTERVYIMNAINEVMEEMGYRVVGTKEVTKKRGTHFKSELYTEGDGTGVDITYSSDGSISMELGAIDDRDRLPTEEESRMLCREMEEFCRGFDEIEKRLFEKGVVLKERISMLPPTEDYAQIIDTSDYKMKENVQKIQLKKKNQTKKQEKAKKKE